MYRELIALMEAKSKNGEDGQDIVEGAIQAIREFVTETCRADVPTELARLAKLLTDAARLD